MNYKTEDLALQIKQARENAALSQRELSARSGVTQSHISQIESGKLSPGIGTMVDIGRALDMELVLIPKRLMTVVSSLIGGDAPSRYGLSPEAGKAAPRQISRGERLVIKQKHLYGPSIELDRMAEYLRFLKRVSLQPGEIRIIVDTIDILDRQPSGDLLKQAVQKLQALRNSIAYGQAEEPRPAYGLDKEDHDA